MNPQIRNRLIQLNSDCKDVSGYTVQHFFCPILYRDDNVELCKAHIINKSFRNSSRTWTIQRTDIDQFYGGHFEADFEVLQEKDSTHPSKIITNKKLMNLLKPQFLLDGEPIEYYRPKGPVPKNHSQVTFITDRESIELVFKVSPDKIEDVVMQWSVDKNIQLPALVSLLKATHLTLFHLCGYEHTFHKDGFFLGRVILGEFFLKTRDMGQTDILNEARIFFAPLVNMVRPVIADTLHLRGTLTDHKLYVCINNNKPWALIIFIQTEKHLNAVLVPLLDSKKNTELFVEFLEKSENILNVRLARWEKASWEMHSKDIKIFWPKAQFKG